MKKFYKTVVDRNICQCKLCGDIIESTHRHHFIWCKCGAIFTDGGKDYIRRGGNSLDNIVDMSVTHEEEREPYEWELNDGT